MSTRDRRFTHLTDCAVRVEVSHMQMVLFFIFVVDFVAFVVLLVASELGYGVSSFEEPIITRRCRMPQEALHRTRTRRQRRRCRSEGYPHVG